METSLGMEVEQPDKVIKLQRASYTQEALTEYKEYIKKALLSKRFQMSSGLIPCCLNASSLLHPQDPHMSIAFFGLHHLMEYLEVFPASSAHIARAPG
jgi:hypothetical protein